MTFKSVALLSSLALSVAGAANANEKLPAQSEYLQEVTAALTLAGYTSIQSVDGSDLNLSAYDSIGRPVLLTVNPKNGTVEFSRFVRVPPK